VTTQPADNLADRVVDVLDELFDRACRIDEARLQLEALLPEASDPSLVRALSEAIAGLAAVSRGGDETPSDHERALEITDQLRAIAAEQCTEVPDLPAR
jgi:hypothetical protein